MNKTNEANVDLAPEEFNTSWADESNYTSIKKQFDSRFGDIELLKSNTGFEVIFMKEKVISNKKEAVNFILSLKKRILMNNKNSLILKGFSVKSKKGLCSTNYLIKSFYSYPNKDARKI